MNNKKTIILTVEKSKDYELIDSGDGEKLERFGKYILNRPDPQALWPKGLGNDVWKKAVGHFIKESQSQNKSGWNFKNKIEDSWSIDFADLNFIIKPTAFKHVGLFPEQASNWEWLEERLKVKRENVKVENQKFSQEQQGDRSSDNNFEVLNLFGYTGGASLICAKAGASVVHVDSSKSAISWGKDNAELSKLSDKPIRWILEDVRVFVEREIKRGRKYDGIIMDPPAFGHGANNEIWKIEDDFIKLIENCFKILKDSPSFFLINGYSAGYSALAYENLLIPLIQKFGGKIEMGELAIRESKDEKTARLLPCGIFARWSKD
jgi:23S rRNA (cytosine1962-C5)-methyltransferase